MSGSRLALPERRPPTLLATFYPDPAVQVLHPRFAKYKITLAAVERLATGLATCEHGDRRVTRTEHDGSITVLPDRFEGKRPDAPNDLVVKSDGSIWFTDLCALRQYVQRPRGLAAQP